MVERWIFALVVAVAVAVPVPVLTLVLVLVLVVATYIIPPCVAVIVAIEILVAITSTLSFTTIPACTGSSSNAVQEQIIFSANGTRHASARLCTPT